MTDTTPISGLPPENGLEPSGVAAPDINPSEAAPEIPEKKEEHQPAPGSKRFNQVYGEAQHWKRTAIEKEARLSDLESKLKAFEEKQAQNEYTANKNIFKDRIKNALDVGDSELAASLQLEFTELMVSQTATRTPSTPEVSNNSVAPAAPTQDLALDNFYAMNPWFRGSEPEEQRLTLKTQEIDLQMKQDPQWANRSNTEFLPELSRRVQDWRISTNNPYRGYAPVGGVQTPPPPNRNRVVLSPEEKRMAEKFLFNSGRAKTVEEAYALYAANKG